MSAEETVRRIPLSPRTKRFMQGAQAAQKVLDAHKDAEFPDAQVRSNVFWFYVGALAAGEYEITEQDDFGDFVMGAATRAPNPIGEDDD